MIFTPLAGIKGAPRRYATASGPFDPGHRRATWLIIGPPPQHGRGRCCLEAAGLRFIDNPVTHPTMTPERIAAQAAALGDGPVLAYCASGTRSSILWSLAQAGRMPVDDILSATARAGYDLSALRPRLGSAQT